MRVLPKVVLYGASGHACAVALSIGFPFASPRMCDVVAFIDDVKGGAGALLEGRPVLSWEEWLRDHVQTPCLVSVARCADKKRLVAKVAAADGTFARLYEAVVRRHPRVRFGAGTILLPPGYIGPNTVIEEHVQIMPMHSIGHDVVIGAYSTVAPSVTISGYVSVGEGVFIGAGATILNGRQDRPLSIGAGAVVAAGAVVTKSVPPGVTVMGNPARPLRQMAVRRG